MKRVMIKGFGVTRNICIRKSNKYYGHWYLTFWVKYKPIFKLYIWIVKLEINGGYKKMKNGIHGNREQLEELSVNRILGELYDKAKAENDGKVHIREIEDGHIGDTIELY